MQEATEESVKRFQQIFDELGPFGGIIDSKEPDAWWRLSLIVWEPDEEGVCDAQICNFYEFKGEMILDPAFKVKINLEGDKIKTLEVYRCVSSSPLGFMIIDENNNTRVRARLDARYDGPDPYGIVPRFDGFMERTVEYGPYLEDPASVMKYDCYLEERLKRKKESKC